MASKAFVQVLCETRGEGKRHHGSEDCEEEWHRKEEDKESGGMSKKTEDNTRDCNCWILSSFCSSKKIPAMQISMHKHIHARMDNPRNADSNWSSCTFSVERESEEWYKEEFQISKTIFHFPPSAGISDLTILWKHSTSETYSSTNAAHVLSLSCISAPPKLKTRTNASVLYAGTQRVAG